MKHSFGSDHLAKRIAVTGMDDLSAFACFGKRGRHIVCGDRAKPVSFIEKEIAEFGLTELSRVRQDCRKHRFQLARRTADDLEHVGGGGLLLQRLALLVEQTRVLDGDDGLVGEVLNQRNLLLSEGSDLHAANQDCPDRISLAQQRSGKGSSMPVLSRIVRSLRKLILGSLKIGDVHGGAVDHGSARDPIPNSTALWFPPAIAEMAHGLPCT